MTFRLTSKGRLGLLLGLGTAAAAQVMIGLQSGPPPSPDPPPPPPPSFEPTERIDVEQSLDFPYDI